MRIAIIYDMIYPFSIGGAELRNYELAKRLAKNHEVHLYGVKLWDGPDVIRQGKVSVHGVCRYNQKYGFSGKRTILEPVRFALALIPEMMKERFDVIDTSSFVYFHCFPLKLVSFIKKTPLIMTWHQYWGDYWYEYMGKFKGLIGITIERIVRYMSNYNIAVSKTTKNDLIKNKIKSSKIFVNYNGVDFGEIASAKPSGQKQDLIFVGRLTHQKNLSLLIEAVRILKRDFPNISLTIVGDGPNKPEIERKIKSLGLCKNISLPGFIENKKEIYGLMKSSKLMVLSSILEGFGIVVVEAQACGAPVIVINSAWNASKELIHDKELLAENNPADLADKIKSLLRDNKLRSSLSQKYLRLSKEFGWDDISKNLEAYYERVVAEN